VTLQRRLIVALTVVALIVVGSIVGDLLVLRASLRNELDEQLFAATRELVDRASQRPAGDPSHGEPGQLPDLFVSDTTGMPASARPAVGANELPRLSPEVLEAHATDRSARFDPFDAVTSDGRHYRVTAVRGTGQRMVVTAVPTEAIDATFRRAMVASAIVCVALLTALALAAWWIERLGLRPIREVTAAAGAIASGEMTRRVDPPPAATEAGHLARAFNVMVDERQAAEDRLRRFVADASHELRTPLTTIVGVHELFQSGSLVGPELDEAMRRAGSEARRMTSLVEDLLLLTQLDHGRPLADDKVDLAALIRDAVIDIGLVDPERSVTVEIVGPAIVRGDEARLRQVVGNLVDNALTHTPRLTALHLAARPDNGGCVLEVCDEGPGLTAEQVEHVFDRFYRVDPGRSRQAGGTGLGLSIVHSIVGAHRGKVSVIAALDRGCCFRVMLPADLQQTSKIPSGHGEVGLSQSQHGEHSQIDPQSTRDRTSRHR
jgi:two-component system, OmpR family, sensor kinase